MPCPLLPTRILVTLRKLFSRIVVQFMGDSIVDSLIEQFRTQRNTISDITAALAQRDNDIKSLTAALDGSQSQLHDLSSRLTDDTRLQELKDKLTSSNSQLSDLVKSVRSEVAQPPAAGNTAQTTGNTAAQAPPSANAAAQAVGNTVSTVGNVAASITPAPLRSALGNTAQSLLKVV